MPVYQFSCKSCGKYFEDLCSFEEIKNVRCGHCKSKKIEREFSIPMIIFKNPRDTSKFDNFGYRAGWLGENAKNESRAAREEAKKRGIDGYNPIDDISRGDKFDPAKW